MLTRKVQFDLKSSSTKLMTKHNIHFKSTFINNNIPRVIPQVGSREARAYTDLTPYLVVIERLFPIQINLPPNHKFQITISASYPNPLLYNSLKKIQIYVNNMHPPTTSNHIQIWFKHIKPHPNRKFQITISTSYPNPIL